MPFVESDLPRLVTWLAAPHVAAWWRPATPAEIEAKYLPRLRGETNVCVYAILLNSEPIGMVQAAPREDAEGAHACNIDLLIGEAEFAGVGLGPQIIDAFTANEVFGRLGFATCFADPASDNRRSIRAFGKAGFKQLRSVEVDGQTFSLMVRKRDAMTPQPVCE